MVREENYDVVIVGCGVGGLYTALNLPSEDRILMICKEDIESCDSMLAQGGICVLRDETDYDAYFEDTMRAGHYENRKESVDIMIRSSRDVINNLLKLGVGFDKNPDGSLKYTKEGAHSQPRICFHEDITGKEITTTLQTRVKELPNVEIREYTVMTDILVENGICTGILAKNAARRYFKAPCERHGSGDRRHRRALQAFDELPEPDGRWTGCGKETRRASGASRLCPDSSDQPVQQEAGTQLPDFRIDPRRGGSSVKWKGRALCR